MRTAIVALACLLGLSACNAAAASPSPSDRPPSDAVVLQVTTAGGFVGPGAEFGQLPGVTIYGDGRVFRPGATPAIFPGPALPSYGVARLTGAGVDAVIARAKEAGLAQGNKHYGLDGVSDAPTTFFSLTLDGRTTEVSAYGLGIEGSSSTLGADILAARRRLAQFAAWLETFATAASNELGPAQPFVPTRIAILAQRTTPREMSDPSLVRIKGWSLADLSSAGQPADGFFPGARCLVIEGDDLAAVGASLAASHTLTLWSSGDALYRFTLRPLLPHETGCPAPRAIRES